MLHSLIKERLARVNTTRWLATAALMAALLIACTSLPPMAHWCLAPAPQCARQALKTHAVHRLESWDTSIGERPVAQRIATASPQLVEYLGLDNVAHGFASTPRAAVLDKVFVADVRQAMERLPAPVLAAVDARLLGVFFVEGLGSTGFSDIIDRGAKNPRMFIVLDAGVLSAMKANSWATWKEGTPFSADPAWRLQARIESDAQDTRENAIQYILLHELAHVLAGRGDIHPDWALAPAAVKPEARYPFFDISWRIDRQANRYVSRWDAAFPQRTKVKYYVGAQLAGSDLLPTYEGLERTDFPTLYAATHPADDFAESLANYVHVVLMTRPWSVTISSPEGVLRTIGPCWEERRCRSKKEALETLLARTAPPAAH